MYLVENLKKTLESLTGIRKPSATAVRALVRDRKAHATMFADDGAIPNNPDLPAVVYAQAVRLDRAADPAAVLEELFKANQWGESWRNGIYDYVHYHSSIHEALGIARGQARVRLGGDAGKELDVTCWCCRRAPAITA